MSSIALVLLGTAILAASGLLGLCFGRRSMLGQRIVTLFAVAGAGTGLAGVGRFWSTGTNASIIVPWRLPGAEFNVMLDGLSAVFLLPVFLISLVGSVYGLGYWKQTDHPRNGRKLRFFYGSLAAGMALLVVARNSILFMFGWEIMALSAYFLVTTEDHDQEVCDVGWLYLVATHVATLSLFAVFALLHHVSGTFALTPISPDRVTPGTARAVFVLALIGFGLKAGVMPLHIWLPSSHAIAPSHVSAVMSGVILKMGIYGLCRVFSLMPAPPLEQGAVVLVLGVVSGVLGVLFAIGQHDLKRLLAYHSIENIGIILMGLGLALLGRALNHPVWIVLGLGGALFHVWNHALFKALLFLSAGSVIHSVHTRDIDHLGGLAKRMPLTAFCFLMGAVAICGLPPLNGFVSEFLIYLGLFGTLNASEPRLLAGAAFAAPALALIGTLAVACFVKVWGAVFLGTPRFPHAREPHESPATMTAAMLVLVGCCGFIGLASPLVAPMFDQAISAWAPDLAQSAPRLSAVAPLTDVTHMAILLVALLAVAGVLFRLLVRRRWVADSTWGCGYLAPTPRMQYTSSSFAQILVGLFGWVLRPRTRGPGALPLFPERAVFHSHVPDPVLDDAVLPAFGAIAATLSWFRVFQRGSVQTYLVYIFLVLLALLLWR